MAEQDVPCPLTVEQFRTEVKDKLGVVFHGVHSTPLLRSIHRDQCERFLVERYAELARERDQLAQENAAAALAVMTILGPVAADAAIVGRTYGWPEVLEIVKAAAQENARLKAENARIKDERWPGTRLIRDTLADA